MPIGADAVDVVDLADETPFDDPFAEAAAGVTLQALFLIDAGAARGERLVDWIWIRRRRQRPDPVAHALERRVVDRDGRHARAERRAQVPFVDRVVVAVPVQVHPLARLLIPERREIRRADDFIGRQPIEAPVELDRLVRIERVDAAAPPLRHAVLEDRRDAVPERKRLHLHPIDEPAEANERPLEERRRIAHLLHVPEDRLGCRPVVERAVEHELHE